MNNINNGIIFDAFIDDDICNAPDNYIKVYLYLLRYIKNKKEELSIKCLANTLNKEEKDILQALYYWEQQGLLEVYTNELKNKDKLILSLPQSVKHNTIQSNDKNESVMVQEEQEFNLVYLLEQLTKFLNKVLSPEEMTFILQLHTDFKFSSDMILCMYDYCSYFCGTSLYCVKQVAADWEQKRIKTTKEAKELRRQLNTQLYMITKTLKFNRCLNSNEINLAYTWICEWKFPLEVILEACELAITQTNNPNFRYINAILKSWHETKTLTLKEISKINSTMESSSLKLSVKKKEKKAEKIDSNKFLNFEQHDYTEEEMKAIEEALLRNAEKKISD